MNLSGNVINLITDECKNCSFHACKHICPTDAFQFSSTENSIFFNEKRCISCGYCVRLLSPEEPYNCKAIHPVTNYRDIKQWIEDGFELGVTIGPGLDYYDKHVDLHKVVGAWREIGAKRIIQAKDAAPIAVSGILDEVLQRWDSGEQLFIDSRCATVRNIVNEIRPDLNSFLIKSDSTLFASARIAADGLTNYKIVFLGPNVSYKKHIADSQSSLVHAVITWAEFEALCELMNINLQDCYSNFDEFTNKKGWIPQASDFKKGISTAGIPYKSNLYLTRRQIVAFFETLDPNKNKGFIETLFCDGSCLNGPGIYKEWKDSGDWDRQQKLSISPFDRIINGGQQMRAYEYLRSDCERFLKEHDPEKSVFIMMKFPEPPENLVKDQVLDQIYRSLREHLGKYGLTALRADGKNYSSSSQLWDNLCIYMLGCSYGIAILENKYRDEFNPNVALEYGFMCGRGKKVLLLEENGFKLRRADTVGKLTKQFFWSNDPDKLDKSIEESVQKWMIDLGLPRLSHI